MFTMFEEERVCIQCRQVFETSRELLESRGLPIEVVDCETLVDGSKIFLYFLGESSTELARIAEELGQAGEASVAFHPVIEPAPSGGGCGAGGCGCSH